MQQLLTFTMLELLGRLNVRKVMVAMMLYMLETMTWYLKTTFGQSEMLFGGTD